MTKNTKPLCSCLDADDIDLISKIFSRESIRLTGLALDLQRESEWVDLKKDEFQNELMQETLNNIHRDQSDIQVLMNRLEYTDVCEEHDPDRIKRNLKHIQTLRDAKQRGGIYQEIRTALDAMMTESDKMFE